MIAAIAWNASLTYDFKLYTSSKNPINAINDIDKLIVNNIFRFPVNNSWFPSTNTLVAITYISATKKPIIMAIPPKSWHCYFMFFSCFIW